MNRKQHLAFWVGLAVVAGMALFPPHRVPVGDGPLRAGVSAPAERLAYGFVLARPAPGPVAWDRMRRRGLTVLLVTYALLALLRTRSRGGDAPEDDGDGRDDLPPPPEPHPVAPHRELVTT